MHRLCSHRLMGAGSVGIMQSDFTRRAIMPVHIAAENGGRRRMSSHDAGKKDCNGEKGRGETIALGVKCRIWDFSQQLCPIYASHWLEPSQTCLCADVGELWEHVFFFFFKAEALTWDVQLELVGVTQIFLVTQTNDTDMERIQRQNLRHVVFQTTIWLIFYWEKIMMHLHRLLGLSQGEMHSQPWEIAPHHHIYFRCNFMNH